MPRIGYSFILNCNLGNLKHNDIPMQEIQSCRFGDLRDITYFEEKGYCHCFKDLPHSVRFIDDRKMREAT